MARQIVRRPWSQKPTWMNWVAMFLAMAALGATPEAGGSSGKLIGLASGLILIGIVLYELYLILIPLIEEGDQSFTSVLFILVSLWMPPLRH